MIQNTFIFINRIGNKKEQDLYKQGITTWERFLETQKIFGISDKRKQGYDAHLTAAKKALFQEDMGILFLTNPTSRNLETL